MPAFQSTLFFAFEKYTDGFYGYTEKQNPFNTVGQKRLLCDSRAAPVGQHPFNPQQAAIDSTGRPPTPKEAQPMAPSRSAHVTHYRHLYHRGAGHSEYFWHGERADRVLVSAVATRFGGPHDGWDEEVSCADVAKGPNCKDCVVRMGRREIRS